MSEYKKPYLILFGHISDAIEEIERRNFEKAKELLITAQQKAEQEFIEFEEK